METELSDINSVQIANFLELKHVGKTVDITQPQSLANLQRGNVTFVSRFCAKTAYMLNHQMSCFIIASLEYEGQLIAPHVISNNPRFDFVRILNKFFKPKYERVISVRADISETAVIGRDVSIGPFSTIGKNVIIGKGSVIGNNVVIADKTIIGEGCRIKSGTVIGEKGFGFVRDNDLVLEFIHYGNVVIGDRVEIGAVNTVVAGTFTSTVIENDVKTDDHVHLAHNVRVGTRTLITACVEVSGSVDIGPDVWIGPNSSINNGLKIGGGAFIGIGSTVTKSVQPYTKVAGNPARTLR